MRHQKAIVLEKCRVMVDIQTISLPLPMHAEMHFVIYHDLP